MVLQPLIPLTRHSLACVRRHTILTFASDAVIVLNSHRSTDKRQPEGGGVVSLQLICGGGLADAPSLWKYWLRPFFVTYNIWWYDFGIVEDDVSVDETFNY